MSSATVSSTIYQFLYSVNNTIHPFDEYVSIDILFNKFEEYRQLKNHIWSISHLTFLKRINNIASKNTIIKRNSTYNTDAKLINLYLVLNERMEMNPTGRNIAQRNRIRQKNTPASSNSGANINTNLDEVVVDPNSNECGYEITTPILMPRIETLGGRSTTQTLPTIPPSPIIPKQSHPEIYNSKYPLLCKIGIPINQSTSEFKQSLNMLLSELYSLQLETDLIYTHPNNSQNKLVFIPKKLASQKAYDNWEKKGNRRMKSILEYMSGGLVNHLYDEPKCVKFVTNYIAKTFPSSFGDVANTIGFLSPKRMNVIETAAILSDVGVADKKMMNTLHRHLKTKLNGNDIFCPKRDLSLLTTRLPKQTIKKELYEKPDGSRNEVVYIASVDLMEAIQLDMDRYLESKCNPKTLYDTISESKIPLFKYNTPSCDNGVYICFGTDHGQGNAQFLVRYLLGDSYSRRLQEKADHNTRTISYATIKCRKDPYGILKMTSQETNKGISTLRNNQLIACIDEQFTVRTMLVDKSGHNFHIIDGNVIFQCDNNCQKTEPLPPGLIGNVRIKVIIKSFHILQVGDLAAQMTLQGREGMASCRCIKCNLTKNEWQSGIDYRLLKNSDLISPIDLNIGKKLPRLWNICPSDTVVPILHCQIGTVNDQLYKKLFRQILTIDSGSEEELEKRINVMEVTDTIYQLKETLDYLTINLDIETQSSSFRRQNLIKEKNRLQYKKRCIVLNMCDIERVTMIDKLDCELLTVLEQIQCIDALKKNKNGELTSIHNTIAEETMILEKLNSDVSNLQWDRRTKEISIHTKVERVLENHGITIQAYHGGNLTGGAIIALLQNHEIVMDDISQICHDAIRSRESDSLKLRPPSIDEFDIILNEHRALFKAQDAVYAHLRLICPTIEEKKETRDRISVMKQLWDNMLLSCTPKAHLIFEYAADDQDRFNGLGDKIEDPLEKRHQEQLRMDSIFNKMPGGFEKRMITQLKIEWRNNNPLVVERIEEVHRLTSRKRKYHSISLATERNNVVKRERHRLRRDMVVLLQTQLEDN